MGRLGSGGDERLGAGELVRDRYELVELLGRGGQGEVARAVDHQHGRVVTLKLRPVPDPALRRALLAEARILLSLRPHENLPMVREDFFWRDRYVLVMDWVEGTDLGRILVDTGDPGLPVGSVLDWLGQAAAALGHLHAQGVVHGDVKPTNLVLTPEGRLVLVDFGISRQLEDADRADARSGGPGGPGLVETELVQPGTPGFAAPEGHDGDRAPAADIYGLAATAVALLTGAPPSVGPPRWEGVPHAEAIERALRRGLALDPARRPRSASDLVERLRANLALDLPTGVVTFLSTDLVGSMPRWEEDPAAMAAALRVHDAVVAEAVESRGGRLLSTRGENDATLAVFARAADAVGAALVAQAELIGAVDVAVRMAVHTGETELQGRDYAGRTVNRASRLRAVAEGGQVLVSGTTADLVAEALPEGAELVDLGYRELPDLNRGEQVHALAHRDLLGRPARPPRPEPPPPPVRAAPSPGPPPATPAHADLAPGTVRTGAPRAHADRAPGAPRTGAPAAPDAVLAATPPAAAPSAPVRHPLPRTLVATRTHSFVGRGPELGVIDAAWREAAAGERRLVMVGGEPGIGKTQLAVEAAASAHAQGALVLHGRCDEGLQVPYQPFAGALTQVLDDAAAIGAHPVLGRMAVELVRLVPDLADRVPGVGAALRADPHTEQYRLFEAAAAWLQAIAARQPVVLVLDDLHWATRPTLHLLRHVTTLSDVSRLLVIGTYRDSELGRAPERAHPLVELLADLRRTSGVRRLALGGLGADEVTRLLEARAGHSLSEPGRALARTVHAETDGNPFFVRELVRHLVEVGALARDPDGRWTIRALAQPLGVPEGVRDVIGRRLARLPDPARRCLEIAAVVGDDFSLPVLAAAGSFDEDAVLGALEQAVEARLVVETGAARFRFSHALIRATILGGQARVRLSRTHRRIAEAIEAVHAADLEDHLSELAGHYAAAASAGEGTKAVDYATRAGDIAMARLAHEEAAGCYALATELLTTTADPVDERERCRLLLRRGDAERLAGDPAYRATLLEAAGVARRWRDAELLAAAAMANARNPFDLFADHDPDRVAVLEAAIELLGPPGETDEGRSGAPPGAPDSPLRARLLARLAVELGADDDGGRRSALSEAAVAMARRLGDLSTLTEVLVLRSDVIWQPALLAEREALAEEQLALAVALGDPVLEARAALNGVHVAVEAGHLELADERLALARRAADELGQPVLRWQVTTLEARRATMLGRFDDADRLVVAALELGQDAGQPEAPLVYTTQLMVLRRLQGRFADLAWTIDAAAMQHRDVRLGDVMRAFMLVDSGRLDEARELFAPAAADGFDWLPRDSRLLNAACVCAFVAAGVGDVVAAGVLYERIAPYRHHLAVDRLVSIGSLLHPMGLLAATLQRWDEAESCFADALGAHQRLGTRPALALGQFDLAALLHRRGRPADRTRIRNLLDAARGSAEELGMDLVVARADSLAAEVLGASGRGEDRARALGLARRARDQAGRLEVGPLVDELDALCDELERPPLPSALATGRSRFVGRGAELTRLRSCWRKAQSGARQLVLVTGEPGIGKTRLAVELAGLAHREGAVVLFGRSENDVGPALQPFAEALHELTVAGLVDPDSLDPELARLLPDRLADDDGPGEPDAGRHRLFEAMGALLDRLGLDQPVVVVLDDLHAADEATLQLVQHLLGRSTGPGLLILGTYRDTDVRRTHPLAEALGAFRRDRSVERLALRGLSGEEVVALVAALTGPGPDDDVERVALGLAESAAGSPLFVEEIVRHLAESGFLESSNGQWRVAAAALDESNIPEGVRELIGRRLSLLSPAANHVLAAASVLGRDLTFDVLRRMVDTSDEVVMVAVDEAQAGGMLVERRGGSGSRLAFSHALVRETLYGELSLPDRQRLHLRAAQAIEAASDGLVVEHQAGALASHYRQAGAAADAESVLVWSVRAAEAAIRVFAFEDAAALLRQAIEMLAADRGRDVERARLLERLGKLRFFAGERLEEGVERGEEALAIYERLGEDVRAAKVHSQLGAHFSTGAAAEGVDIDRAFRHFRAAAPVLAGGNDLAAAYFHLSHGVASMRALQLEAVEEGARRAMAIAEACGDRALWANTALLLGLGRWERGAVDGGGSLVERAWDVADELDRPVLALLIAWNRGGELLALGDPAAALGWFERDLDGPRFRQAPRAAAVLRRHRNRCLLALGRLADLGDGDAGTWPLAELHVDPDRAPARLAAQLDRARAAGDRWSLLWQLPGAAAVSREVGQHARAVVLLDEAAELVAASGSVTTGTLVATEQVFLATACGRTGEARRILAEAHAVVVPGGGWRGVSARLTHAEATVLAAEGAMAEADGAFRRALQAYRTGSRRWSEAALLADWGRALLAAGDRRGGAERIGEARSCYRSFGASERWAVALDADLAR